LPSCQNFPDLPQEIALGIFFDKGNGRIASKKGEVMKNKKLAKIFAQCKKVREKIKSKSESCCQQEKRKFIRVDTSLLVSYRVVETKELSEQASLAKNISEEGLLLELPTHFAPDTILELKVALPTSRVDKPIVTLVKTAWANQIDLKKSYDTGVRFIEMNEKDQQELLNYLSSLK